MQSSSDRAEAEEEAPESSSKLLWLRRAYTCTCGRAVFFADDRCLNCNTPLGYEAQCGIVSALAPAPKEGLWTLTSGDDSQSSQALYRRCSNLTSASACNWLLSAEDDQSQCVSCRLTRTIPHLGKTENQLYWQRLEDAKRRVLSALISFGFPIKSRIEDPEQGLTFDFLESPPGGPRVLTGHSSGIITVNVEEADDVKREQARTSLNEPYRTLVGHLRHEIGHYYWNQIIDGTPWLEEFRAVFGDDRADYQAALRRNYREGPPADWRSHFVSAYASVHPWEDWAETWAHYLHIVDTLGTALSFGLKPERISLPFERFGAEALYYPESPGSERFVSFLNTWLKTTAVMNELCRSMGQPDFYPFVLSRDAVKKLHFVHVVALEASAAPPLRP
ncbi:MAG TPA: putative zinc-binding metallopeptidase [Bryobacteraceae bacterium]|jgi:hypothetical protein|nr:putative zinc-binding metallopeptidase [Bryobacteraceae bacterium]